jgi:hypothetical protein
MPRVNNHVLAERRPKGSFKGILMALGSLKYVFMAFYIIGIGLLVGASLAFINDEYDGAIILAFLGVGFIVIPVLAFRNIARGGTIKVETDISLPWSGRTASRIVSGVADVWYVPRMKHMKMESQFLEKVARFGAKTMDRIGKNENVSKITIWAEGNVPLEDGTRERVWKGIKLVLDKSNWRGPAIGELSNYAHLNTEQFLRLCSLQYIDISEIPEWPKINGSSPV